MGSGMGAAEKEKLYREAICKRHHFSADIGFIKQVKIVREIFHPELSPLKESQVLCMKSYRKGDSL